jgi:hypothetical protein
MVVHDFTIRKGDEMGSMGSTHLVMAAEEQSLAHPQCLGWLIPKTLFEVIIMFSNVQPSFGWFKK